ncbi:hypothetical protein HK104_001122 [Borealophlyctis nickersoniae]|nr:hypothetical protein HK104_001122 [Borealophlyctis nickersoniae]
MFTPFDSALGVFTPPPTTPIMEPVLDESAFENVDFESMFSVDDAGLGILGDSSDLIQPVPEWQPVEYTLTNPLVQFQSVNPQSYLFDSIPQPSSVIETTTFPLTCLHTQPQLYEGVETPAYDYVGSSAAYIAQSVPYECCLENHTGVCVVCEAYFRKFERMFTL